MAGAAARSGASRVAKPNSFDKNTIFCISVLVNERVTSTEVVRRFGDLLAEIRYGGKSVTVTKNGEPVAELRPAPEARRCTLREFVAAWAEPDEDDSFAVDLEAVNAADQPPASPWD